MENKARFLVYYRVSTRTQGESGLGLEAQRSYIHHFIPDESIVDEVTEIQSAKSLNDRPVLQAAIERCRREGHTLAVAKLDRLSRNLDDARTIYRVLSGRLYACDLPGNPGEGVDEFVFNIVIAVAHQERKLISIRTKQALQAKKKRDGSVHPVRGHVSNFTVGGREKAAAKKRATAKREDQKVRLAIRELRRAGDSLAEIARKLNLEGHSTPNGKPFHSMQVKRILERNGQ